MQELKILFVEDREDDMILVLRVLYKGGFKVKYSRVQSAPEEREKLASEEWDLVIADYSMPGFSGREALAVFNEFDLDIPFILVSGSVKEDVALQMMQEGARDYIMKDKLGKLVSTVSKELEDVQLRRKKKAIEDELYQAKLFIESTDVIMWQWEPSTGWPVLYVSNNVQQFGYTPEELISRKIVYADILHPEDKEAIFENSLDNRYNHHDLYKQNYRIVCKDGSIRWLDDYTTIVRDDKGEVTLVQGITYDVTDNTLLEKDLDWSRNLYRSLVDTSPDGICMIDMNYSNVFVNKRKAALLGYDNPEELIGKHAMQSVAPAYHQFLKDQERELLTFGKLSIPEIEFIRKDGTSFFGELRMVLIRNEEGEPVNIINLITDITERKQMQENLIESENRFRISFENAPIGMDMIQLDNRIMKANKAFCELVGYSEDELLNMTFYDFTHPDDINNNVAAVDTLKAGTSDSVSIVKRYIRKDGEEIWVRVNSTMIKSSQGIPLYFLAQVQDITKSKQAEEEIMLAKRKAEESDRLKSALLANMSHELRTPLNGILGFSEIIRKTDIDESLKGMGELIYRSGTRLMSTLDSIMLLAQLESNQKLQDITYMLHNASSELESIANAYKNEIQSKGFEFNIKIEPGLLLKCEAKLFRQAIIKLLENAIKFTDRGSIGLSAKSISSEEFEIQVCDTGIGFSKDAIDDVFAAFKQVSQGYGRAYEGSGLGLSITQKIITLFGGSIGVSSEIGKGSTFTIKLPKTVIATSIKNEPEQLQISPKFSLSTSSKLPLLVVEDNPINQKLVVNFLKNQFEVECAATGETALDMVKEKHYDVILMDINLGSGMDGIQTTQEIRKLSGYEVIPVIAVTGYTLIGDRERILAGGCSHYLGKPFSRDQLLETIQVACEAALQTS